MKYLNLKLSPAVMVAIVFGVLAVFGGAKAFQSYSSAPKIVVEGNQIYHEAAGQDVEHREPEEVLVLQIQILLATISVSTTCVNTI